MFNWTLWLNGMYAAALAGGCTGGIDALTNGDMHGAAKTAAVAAILGALLYLKTHPPLSVPPEAPK